MNLQASVQASLHHLSSISVKGAIFKRKLFVFMRFFPFSLLFLLVFLSLSSSPHLLLRSPLSLFVSVGLWLCCSQHHCGVLELTIAVPSHLFSFLSPVFFFSVSALLKLESKSQALKILPGISCVERVLLADTELDK